MSETRKKRTDIQAVRAIAVILVMLWHANINVPGGYVGVDVFFVISGFLMTDLLIRGRGDNGNPKLIDFYARRARRLLPASLTALLGVLVLTREFLPKARWHAVSHDILYSIGFSMNWREVRNSVDYLHFQSAPSPLQHYWSLGVEEQFYFVWPAVLAIFLYQQAKLTLAQIATVVLFAGSLAWSIIQTHNDPAQSYFSSFTRVWELLLGALIALFASQVVKVSAKRATATGLTVAGVALIAYASAAFDTSTPFPGWKALIPTVGAFLILLANGNASLGPVQKLVDSWPVQKVGDLSYSLYLWHWPLLVAATAKYGVLSAWQGLAVLAVGFIPAILSYRYIEEPVRRRKSLAASPKDTYSAAGIALLGSTVVALLFLANLPDPEAVEDPTLAALQNVGGITQTTAQKFGAATLKADALNDPAGVQAASASSIYPDPGNPGASEAGCESSTTNNELVTCSYGPDTGLKVLVVGDSHARQWMRPLTTLASTHNWHLTEVTKDFCLPITAKISSPWVSSCQTWGPKALSYIAAQKPDVIITSNYDYRILGSNGRAQNQSASTSALTTSLTALYRTWTAGGAKVIVLRNTPQPAAASSTLDIADCVSGHLHALKSCTFSRAKGDSALVGAAGVAAAKAAPASLIDLNDAICPDAQCAAVLGGILVYRDNNHMTGAYAATMQPRLDAALLAADPAMGTATAS